MALICKACGGSDPSIGLNKWSCLGCGAVHETATDELSVVPASTEVSP